MQTIDTDVKFIAIYRM